MSLPSHKVDTLVKQKLFWSKALAGIKSNTDRLLIAILVGNNLVNVYAAALATQISISIARSSGMEEALAVWIATWIITFLILVFGEIVPKSFASKNAEKISLWVAYPYKILILVLFPVIYVLEKLILLFTGKGVQTGITEEEIETFIDLWKDAGTLEDDEHERLKNTLEFSDTLVEEIMVPRVKIDALSDTYTIEEALEYYLAHTHSRIPVYHDQIDNIVWILTIRDILRERRAWHNDNLLSSLHFKKFLKVPINQPIDNLLDTFKSTRQHIAVVMDEYGWVAGITTIEDIIEEIFGEILELSDLGMEDKEFWSETVSYMITHKLERFPKKDEEISFPIYDENGEIIKEKLCFKVLEIDDTTIGKIEATRK